MCPSRRALRTNLSIHELPGSAQKASFCCVIVRFISSAVGPCRAPLTCMFALLLHQMCLPRIPQTNSVFPSPYMAFARQAVVEGVKATVKLQQSGELGGQKEVEGGGSSYSTGTLLWPNTSIEAVFGYTSEMISEGRREAAGLCAVSKAVLEQQQVFGVLIYQYIIRCTVISVQKVLPVFSCSCWRVCWVLLCGLQMIWSGFRLLSCDCCALICLCPSHPS